MIDKPWGKAYPLYIDSVIELVKIVVCQGGCSSKHLHENKSNGFVVSKGRLRIWTQDGEEPPEVRELIPGDAMMTITAGVLHQFCAMEDGTIAYEVYTAVDGVPIDDGDIVRQNDNVISIET